ncbi:MAG: biotin/lipoyl-binding protein [Legionellaceae bacterium]|nr:biotin/lipoyl-binding protein [Legionellaceae bacterium]
MILKSYTLLRKLPKPITVFKVVFTVFSLITLFFLLTPWQQFALANGRVVAFSPTERQFTISSPINGRVQKWYVNEGSEVKKGDLIVELSDNDPEYIQRLKNERTAIIAKVAAAERALQAGVSNVNRQEKLFKEGISSKRKYELAQIELSKYQDELAQARILRINNNVALARQKTQKILAESSGTIFRRLSGQENVIVMKGDKVAEIVPKTPSRAVELWVDGNDISFVRVNQIARVQFEGWPAVQFRGWPEIAVGTFSGLVSFIDTTDSGSGQFRIVVVPNEPWPDFNYLRQGVLVHGWVQLGRVRLWYELWRQFNGFPPESGQKK